MKIIATKTTTPSFPTKEMKAFKIIFLPPETVRWRGLILLLAEKSAGNPDRDEHQQTGILTPGLPRSRLPAGCSGLWEFVARYSGATVSGFHGVPGRLLVFWMETDSICFKERGMLS